MLKSFLEYNFPMPSGAGNPLPPNKNMKTSVHVRNNILNLLLRIVPALRLLHAAMVKLLTQSWMTSSSGWGLR